VSLNFRTSLLAGAVAAASLWAFSGNAVQASDVAMPAKDETVHAQLPQEVKDRGVIRIVSTFGYAPQQFFAEDGKTPDGFSVDLGKALGAVAGVPVEFTNASFDSLIPGLDAGRFDMVIAAMSATAERGAKVNFVIYQKTDARLLVPAGNPENIGGLQDLCGLKVASLKGSLYNQVIESVSAECTERGKEAVELSTYDNSDSVYQALITGRVDANYRDSAPLIYTARASEGRLEVVGPEYPDTPYGIAIAGGNTDLAKATAMALDVLIKDGTYQAILDKWGLGSRAVDAAALTAVGASADSYPRPPSAVDIAFDD
jgi:polar amino acid transport system substrate-binding protein